MDLSSLYVVLLPKSQCVEIHVSFTAMVFHTTLLLMNRSYFTANEVHQWSSSSLCYHVLHHSEAASLIEQWKDPLKSVTVPAIWQCLARLGHISPQECLFSLCNVWHCFFLIQYSLVWIRRWKLE